ncbi:PIR Superfamily Protein [Plasmodium ovale curtisi]|uniref:PIR Superfamily Protein n=1 Tax=Plasmodium ovale curtisi TaxID=864141 RepID=A0A1A8WCU6_PLAOA|nr:PIR Superfamily Protein [Plasmodium ovale curtisi]
MEGGSFEVPEGFVENYLSTLPSKLFYNDMKKNYEDLSKYSQKCEQIIVNNKQDELKEICKKYLRYLENNYTLWNKVTSGYDVCILLNYWIYDTLTGLFGSEDSSGIINVAFGNLQLVGGYLDVDSTKKPFYDRCKPNYEMFRHKDWKKRKELYEYYIDYDTIKRLSDIYIPQCKDFYAYIEGKSKLYEHFENECLSNEHNCPDFYDKSSDYNPKKVLQDLSCHAEMVAAKQAITRKDDSRVEVEPAARAHASDEPEHGTPSYDELLQENSNIGTKVGHSVLGVAPVLLTATALYKYTPIGSWIRNLGGYNQSSLSNIDGGEMNGFLANTQGSDDMFFGDTEIYISYQPV